MKTTATQTVIPDTGQDLANPKSEIRNPKAGRKRNIDSVAVAPAGNLLNRRLPGGGPWTLIACFLVLGVAALAADTPATATTTDQVSSYRTIGLSIAAAVSVGASILGAGYAVGRIGSAAIGAIAEKPELLPRAMLFVALGEGLAVLGFAFAIWLLLRM